MPAGKKDDQSRVLGKDSVLHEEHAYFQDDPENRGNENYAAGSTAPSETIHERLWNAEYWALCLSGGGIRSATFTLGVLQGLAEHGLLDKFHYLSTVSGGGYIGSWLSSWIGRPNVNLKAVVDKLADHKNEPNEIRRLRAFSNYLSPVWGLSTDFFTLVSTFLRNLLLNWLVLLPLLAAVLLLPRIYIGFLDTMMTNPAWAWALPIVAAVMVTLGIAYMVADFPRVIIPNNVIADHFPSRCFLPITVAALLLSLIGGAMTLKAPNWLSSVYDFMLAGATVHLFGGIFGLISRRKRGIRTVIDRNFGAGIACVVISGIAGGALVNWMAFSSIAKELVKNHPLLYATIAAPALLFCFWVTTTIYVLLVHKISSEMDREWWARSGAWWLRACLGWILLFALVIYGPQWVFLIPGLDRATPETLGAGGGALGVIAALIGYVSKNGAMLKHRARSLAAATGMRLLDLAAVTFALILVLTLSYFESWGLNKRHLYTTKTETVAQQDRKKKNTMATEAAARATEAAAKATAAAAKATAAAAKATAAAAKATEAAAQATVAFPQVHAPLSTALKSITAAAITVAGIAEQWLGMLPTAAPGPAEKYAKVLNFSHEQLGLTVMLFSVLAGFGVVIPFFVGVNTFSLHSMYGNRLVRAYLGATNDKRTPHWFTGFDPDDNIDMHDLKKSTRIDHKLFPVVNVALNLVKPSGDRLEWQQRKSASFTISPLHAGSADENVGFQHVKAYAGDNGISLGGAMTISGAAASPNMGYHTSAPVAFVMAFFNIRLGWWLPNPGGAGAKVWYRREPEWSLRPLLSEALAQSTDKSPYVYLSDGGHFENLGLYEMVRRRCRKIMVVDASCDPSFEFGDLQNAIRKVRVDFGVTIEFDDILPTPETARVTKYHYALGRIRYPATSGRNKMVGDICYIKPVLSGDEPLDVTCYAAEHAAGASPFPHQTTADQFFDEAQFESYRMLGLHSVKTGFPGKGGWPASAPTPKRASKCEGIPQPLRVQIVDQGHDGTGAPLPSQGLLSGVTKAFGSMSQGALVASAITVGGLIGVSGTVALKDSTVSLKPGAEVSLSDTDRTLLRGPLPLDLSEPFRQELLKQLETARKSVVKILEDIEKKIPSAPSPPDLSDLTKQVERLAGAITTLRDALPPGTKIVAVGGSVDLSGIVGKLDAIREALANKEDKGSVVGKLAAVLDKLHDILTAVDESKPRQNIRGTIGGTQ